MYTVVCTCINWVMCVCQVYSDMCLCVGVHAGCVGIHIGCVGFMCQVSRGICKVCRRSCHALRCIA